MCLLTRVEAAFSFRALPPLEVVPRRTRGEMTTTSALIFSLCLAVAHGFVVPHGPVRSTPVGCRPAAAAPLLPAQQLLSSRVAPRSTAAPVMGLFGLGAPELAIIGGVALMILGPDQLKKLAKDVGKVSAELKQVSTRSSPSPLTHLPTVACCVARCRRSSTRAWRRVPRSWRRRRRQRSPLMLAPRPRRRRRPNLVP